MTLEMPRPAQELWANLRGPVRAELSRISGGSPAYAIGGGAVLAARWKHRESHDVDLVVQPETPLAQLARENDPGAKFEAAMEALGGRLGFNSDMGLWTVEFDDGQRKLDLWATTPLITEGAATATIDGRTETLLSSAQILRGKLERGWDHPARDVFDLVTAAKYDPGALEAAVNAISRQLCDDIAITLHWAKPEIADDARTELTGVADKDFIELSDLGPRAARTVTAARYEGCRIATRDGRIEVTTTTAARGTRTRRIGPEKAAREFEAQGLTPYLRTNGPGDDKGLVDYARAAATNGQNVLVFEAAGGTVKAWRTATRGMNPAPGNAPV